MLTETLSGKCPCCNYDKLLQRYGSQGYYQLDGCPNCGFGYGHSMGQEEESVVGEDAWLNYAAHLLACCESEKYESMFQDDECVVRQDLGVIYNNGDTKETKAHYHIHTLLMNMPKEELRKQIFDWAEKQERSSDVETTVFKYTEEDIKKYMATNPKIFKP
jgi:hypothetical protein